MAETEIYLIENDNLIRISGLRDAANLIYLNNVTLELTLLSGVTGEEISGQPWPTTMTYVDDSDGVYQATLEDTLNVSEHQHLVAKIEGAPFGMQFSLRVPILAVYRRGD